MEHATTQELALRVACALALGALVGAERQWRQRLAGLRTNTLVAVGAALFVALSAKVDDVSATRVAAQVVSGIGFLGAGVIFKEGASVRGLDTAATLWCSGAVGVLSGSGFYIAAAVGASAILLTNMLIRPLVPILNRQPTDEIESDVGYRLHVTCSDGEPARVRETLLHAADRNDVLIRAIHCEEREPARVEVVAEFLTVGRRDALIENVLRQLSVAHGVGSIRWEVRSPAV